MLTNEDKKDVAGAMGKKMANKVSRATDDSLAKSKSKALNGKMGIGKKHYSRGGATPGERESLQKEKDRQASHFKDGKYLGKNSVDRYIDTPGGRARVKTPKDDAYLSGPTGRQAVKEGVAKRLKAKGDAQRAVTKDKALIRKLTGVADPKKGHILHQMYPKIYKKKGERHDGRKRGVLDSSVDKLSKY